MSDEIIVSRPFVGLCHAQLCAPADATDAALLEVANRDNPSGTKAGWTRVIRDGEGDPVPCADDPLTRRHFLVRC